MFTKLKCKFTITFFINILYFRIMNWLETYITLPTYDNVKDEKANAYTHFFGAVYALGALIYIIYNLNRFPGTTLKIGMIIFGLSNLLLYAASGFYHYLPKNNAKRVCRILDHSNIYILIAGTYTPILLYINSPTTIAIAWALLVICVLGIAFTLIFWERLKPFHVVLYLLMGWMLVFFWKAVVPFIPNGLINYIIAGGITYSLGIIFYACKKIPYYHAIWHLFVLGGSFCFYLGFFKYLMV